MQVPAKLLLILIATFFLGCLFAPPLYWLGNSVAPTIEFLQGMTFQRYFNRAFLLAALLMLWPARIWLGVASWRELGLRKNPRAWTDLGVGLAAAFVLLMVMGYIGHLTGVYYKQEIHWNKMWKAPGTAAAVSLLEEWLFRGVLLGLCLRVMRPVLAIGYISALYSILHFLKPIEEGVEITQVTWLTGFEMLPHTFHQFADPLLVLSGFTTLLAIGIVLALTRVKTASLWMAIGLHAGWILGNRVFNIAFKQEKTVDPAWMTWFYGERIEIGIAPLITVSLTGALVLWWLRGRKLATESPGE